MLTELSRWSRLSRPDRTDFLRLSAAVPAMAAAVRLLGYHRTTQLITAPRRALPEAEAHAAERQLSRALKRVQRHAPYRGNCLSQSMALHWLLARRGVATVVCLGARVENGAFLAHAWVELDGRVLNDTPDVRERFAPFQRPASRISFP